MNNSAPISVLVLDGKNYNRWNVQLRVLFDYHELLDVVENGVSTLAENETDAQKNVHHKIKKKDKKALYFIHQGVNDEVFEKIARVTITKQAWDILMTSYKGAERVKKVRLQTLRRQYELLQMESSETIANYIGRVLALTNQMNIYGEECIEQTKVEKILRSLNSSFEHVVVTIEKSHDLSLMTVNEVSDTLQAHEQRMNEKKIERSIEQAFHSQVSIKGYQSGETSQNNSSSHGRGRGRGGYHFNKGHGGHNNNHGVTGGNDQEKSNSSHQQNSRSRGRG
ncbi:uncharacterized protein LOC123204412 [Mangifera indica]|uniref:uncharacterized protein LOC123204412 n=1 Tax=Mangifera indica TaxID=29780 RepID=UPI001CFB66C9|nr:uncharacterized protein LOC123204412 [Mangifera indica]